MIETTTEIERFKEGAVQAGVGILVVSGDGVDCVVRSEAAYNQAGALLVSLRTQKKAWADWLKTNPKNKKPSECEGLEAAYFFAYQNLERMRKLLNDGLAWFEPREKAVENAIREYDARKQEELRRKHEAADRARREAELAAEKARREQEENLRRARESANQAERARLEAAAARLQEAQEARLREAREAELRAGQRAAKAEEIARGPAGTVKVTRYAPSVTDKAAFLRWVVRTENWQLAECAEGLLTKHVNALDGNNLPDGVVVRREDVIRRGR